MIKIKEDNYKQFTAQERLNLTVAALSRDDAEEAGRLYKTCPKYKYLATDYEFTKRVDAITWVGEKYVELCQYYYDKILISQASISGMILAGEALASKMSYSCIDMNKVRIGHISSLKSVHQGLVEFCEVVGVDYSQLILWMCRSAERGGIEGYLSLNEAKPDIGFTAHIKDKFLSHWESYCGLR